jgi:hypothetical protein
VQDVTQLPKQSKSDYDPQRENSIHHWVVFASGYGENDTGRLISTLSGTTTVEVAAGYGSSVNPETGSVNRSQNVAYRERHNVEGEDIDSWGINEAAVSIRPNGLPRQFYARVQVANAELLGVNQRRGEPARFALLPDVEEYTRPDPEPFDEEEWEERPQRPQQERGRERSRDKRERVEGDDQDDDIEEF